MAVKKYRPYFTLPELRAILETQQASGRNPALIQYLERFIADTEMGLRKENLSLAPSLGDRLGGTVHGGQDNSEPFNPEGLMLMYRTHGYAGMTPVQMLRIKRHRYDTGDMSREEMREYEAEQGVPVVFRTPLALPVDPPSL